MKISSLHSKNTEPTGVLSSILTLTMMLVVFYSFTNIAVAHEECPTHPTGFRDFKEPPGWMPRPVSPDEMGADFPSFPFEALDLTETQSDKVFQILHSAALDLHEKQKVIRKTMESLHQVATADKFDVSKAKLISEEHAKALADLIFIHTEIQAKIWEILTDAQRNRLIEIIKPRNLKP
jgi:Spy/CpxP family protein refolding chaperone